MTVTLSPLSGLPARPFFTHTVLGKHEAQYYYDDEIGYIFAANPHWLDEAYSSAIAITDTGILIRNSRNVAVVSEALSSYDFKRGVDLGGGYGLFVRGMRDVGFEFFWTDKYAQNIFARGFEADHGSYCTAVAFEVLEHLENPLTLIRKSRTAYHFDTLLFSATCFNEHNIPCRDWWYWAFETGQHISFFSERALRWMADQLEMHLFHITADVFAFSTKRWVCGKPNGSPFARLVNLILRARRGKAQRKSLTFDDHTLLRDALRRRTAA